MRVFLSIILLIILLTSCKPDQKSSTKEFTYGSIENGLYKNEYFNFSIQIPPEWSIQSDEFVEELNQMGKDLLDDGHNHDHGESHHHNHSNEFDPIKNFLVAYELEVGSNPAVYNTNISILAEDLSLSDETISAHDYLQHSKQLLMESNLDVSVVKQTSTTLASKNFEQLTVDIDLNEMRFTQNFYVRKINNYIFIIITSHDTDEQAEALADILRSVSIG